MFVNTKHRYSLCKSVRLALDYKTPWNISSFKTSLTDLLRERIFSIFSTWHRVLTDCHISVLFMYTSADETKEAAKQRIEFIINLHCMSAVTRSLCVFIFRTDF